MNSQVIKRPRLEFLDGIRGLCALYVACFHATLFTGHSVTTDEYSSQIKLLKYLLSFGHYSVAVFIVLSGFCLTIPIALSDDKKLRGGFKKYIGRRARRILPPYYIALFIFLILIACLPVMQTPRGTAWDSKIPVSAGAIVSHLLLVHNLHPNWIYKIDGPMWSVATEWQIYFCFPILLILWRCFGLWVAVAIGVAVGFIPMLVLPTGKDFSWLHPWYLGLFAMGMAGAIIAFSEEPRWIKLRNQMCWQRVTPLAVALCAVILTLFDKRVPISLSEILVGFAVVLVIVHYTLLETSSSQRTWFLKLLNSGVAVRLGVFSYSIYLIHSPLLGLFNLAFLNVQLSLDVRLLLILFVAVPLSVFLSYIFHILVERRFMPGHIGPHQMPVHLTTSQI